MAGELRRGDRKPTASAAVIAVRRAPDGLQVLLGRRSAGVRFLGGWWAFPGGAVEAADVAVSGVASLEAHCAAREFGEETGLVLDPGKMLPAGQRVTPPFFRRRFRTAFFVAEWRHDGRPAPPPATGENDRLEWLAPREVLADWLAGRRLVAPPVTAMLRSLVELKPAAPLERIATVLEDVNRREETSPRIEFLPGAWLVPLATETLPPATHTNAALLGGRRFVIVDPGSAAPEECERLCELVGRRAAEGGEPEAILLTHHHGDHVAGAAIVARTLDLPVLAHPETVRMLRDPALRDLARGELVDGQLLDLEGETLRVVHTPGHAPGHLALFCERVRLAVVADLVSGISSIIVPPDSGDMGAYLASLDRVAGLRPRLLLPGHGPPLPPEILERVRDHRLERERSVLEAMDAAGRTTGQLAAIVYEGERVHERFAEAQTLAHLRDLERRGLVRRAGETWFRR